MDVGQERACVAAIVLRTIRCTHFEVVPSLQRASVIMSGWCSSGYWIEMMTALHVRMIEYHRRESVRTEVFFSAPPRITRTKGKDQFLGKISFNQIHLHVL